MKKSLERKKMTVKINRKCLVCEESFVATQSNIKCCSEVCKKKRYNALYRAKYAENPNKVKKPTVCFSNKCLICETNFEAKRSNYKYCSKPCRVIANNNLQSERYRISMASKIKKIKFTKPVVTPVKTEIENIYLVQKDEIENLIKENYNKTYGEIIQIIKENMQIANCKIKMISQVIAVIKKEKIKQLFAR